MTAASKTADRREPLEDEWLTVKDAAVMLGTSRHLVLKRAARGELSTAIAAKRLVISRASVEAALERA